MSLLTQGNLQLPHCRIANPAVLDGDIANAAERGVSLENNGFINNFF
jgi:hypothetical protein